MDSKLYKKQIKYISDSDNMESDKQGAYDALRATCDNEALRAWGDKFWCHLGHREKTNKEEVATKTFKLPEGLTKVLGIDEAMRRVGVNPKNITINITVHIHNEEI